MYLAQKEVHGNKYWYLEESERTEKGSRTKFSLYLGKPERIYDLVEKPLQRLVLSTHTFGTTAAMLHAVEELGLEEILSEEMSLEGRVDMTPAQRLLMILGARYERPASKLDTVADWYKKSLLPPLWKCNVPHVNTVYETMDGLTPDVRERIEERLRARLFDRGLEPKRLVWDTTNFHTYGEVAGLRQRGRSKDGKHKCPLVGMGILTSREDIPLAQMVFPGNRQDVRVFESALPSLLKLLGEVAEDPKDVTLIFDRGCNDEDLIRVIEETTHCVGKLKRNQDPAKPLRIPAEDLEHLYTSERDHEVRGRVSEGEAFGKSRPIAVMWHEGTAKKKKERLRRLKEGALETCKDLEKRVGRGGRGRKFTPEGIRRRLKPFNDVSDAFDWSFDEKSQSFLWEFEKDEWERLLDEAGKSLLFTSHRDWGAEQIIKAYTGKWRIERSFRLLKGPIPARPFFHWEDDRIHEHCFLMFLLLVIHQFLMEEIREPVLEEFEIGEEGVHKLLKEIHLITGKLSDENSPDFSVEERGTIEDVIFNEWRLERFIPRAG
ncbi:hypothetical protein AKJ66_02515 [candidate division MSBL1 archaeon SCGC-AAA259E22]|uniref:Transposase IS4-like domain-containing protein n=1 Tax=candidate division MSBL1 archaeon SCGC-AAA259E22 TaxID=1698265 RepID=A0A133UGI5_9EURY|nr:hypothetical protein AKJ66_02515 [candidate division MSBL1 archaeon SCGC-AAA259E22]